MSMNLYIEATRNAFAFNAKGEKVSFVDSRKFDCWQTPTQVTKSVLAKETQDEKIKEYVMWAQSSSEPYEDDVYDFSGKLDENFDYPVIGKKVVNPAQDHANELSEFLKNCHEEGFVIIFHTM